MAVVDDIMALMENVAPLAFAMEWDNSGLQCGDRRWPVKHVMVALDPSPSVVSAACKKQADMLITHHPLIFRPLKNLVLDTPIGRILELSVRHHLAIFSAHTNLDSVRGGLNDVFAERIGLKNPGLLAQEQDALPDDDKNKHGIGRIGELEKTTTLAALSEKMKHIFGLSAIKVAGAPDMPVRKIAVCTGSGSGLMRQFFNTSADVYISGDLKFHDAKDAQINGRGLIDVGHFSSEALMIDLVARRLEILSREKGLNIVIEVYKEEEDPFQYL
jgi:dinuclear metal center YbgI/SA1388 family protein